MPAAHTHRIVYDIYKLLNIIYDIHRIVYDIYKLLYIINYNNN